MGIELIDFKGLIVVCVLSGLLACLGFAMDRWVGQDRFTRLRGRLGEWWDYIDSITVARSAVHAATFFLMLKDRVFGRRWVSYRFVYMSIGFSVCLTTAAILLCDFLWFNDFFATLHYFSERKLPAIYVLNYVFDVTSLILSVQVFVLLRRARPVMQPVLILLNGVIALLLAILCWIAAASVQFPQNFPITASSPYVQIDKIGRHLTLYVGYIRYIGLIDSDTLLGLVAVTGGWIRSVNIYGSQLANWFFSGTVFLPTIAVIFFLFFNTISLGVSGVLRIFGFRRESGGHVFLFTGVLVGGTAVMIKLMAELFKLI